MPPNVLGYAWCGIAWKQMCLPLQNSQVGFELAKHSETRITYEPMLAAGLLLFCFFKSKQYIIKCANVRNSCVRAGRADKLFCCPCDAKLALKAANVLSSEAMGAMGNSVIFLF